MAQGIQRSQITLNEHLIEPFMFPGGERHVAIPVGSMSGPEVGEAIFAVLFDTNGIMDLLLLADAIKRAGSFVRQIVIPYLPYARQDRVANVGEPLSVAVMAQLINSIEAEEVAIFDLHSPVAAALIDNLREITQDMLLKSRDYREVMSDYFDGGNPVTIIAPDSGAEKKALKVAQMSLAGLATASKVRNTKTGEITKTVFHPEESIECHNVLICDDICDGGRTFIELAKVLREHKPARIGLFVTHGLFTKGLEVFDDLIDDIYTLDYTTNHGETRLEKIK